MKRESPQGCPGVAEEGVTKEDSSGEEEARKDMTMSKARSMRQLFQGQKLTTRRCQTLIDIFKFFL